MHEITPYIRVALDYEVPLGWMLKERVIFDYELLYIKEGEIIVTIEDIEYHGVPGDVFLIKPGEKHAIRLYGDLLLRHPHIHFDFHYIPDSPSVKVSFKPADEISEQEQSWFRPDLCSGSDLFVPNHIRLRSPKIVEEMFYDIIYEFAQKPPYYEHNCSGMFVQLWIHLLRELYWVENSHVLPNLDALNEVKKFMSRNLSEEVSIDRLAMMANLSKFYFIQMFKRAFGTTPSKYHLALRIEKAKQLIQYSSIPITEVAELVGFNSIHAFSRSFRNIEGVPPTYYRRKGGNV